MMISSVIVGILSNTYLVLTALKLTQWGLHKWNRNEGMYIPSFSVFMTLLSLVLMGGEMQVSKIPRKDLRVITDKWIEEYHKKVQRRAPKKFSTHNEALNHFFVEFCNDSPFYVWFVSKTSTPYLNQPLGICTAAQLLLFLLGIPFLVLREVVFMGGGPLTVLCKVSSSASTKSVIQHTNNLTLLSDLRPSPIICPSRWQLLQPSMTFTSLLVGKGFRMRKPCTNTHGLEAYLVVHRFIP